ncbi:SdpI family protein [Anaerovoracaceae bacterium SGI.195]
MNKLNLALYMTSLGAVGLYIFPDKNNILLYFQYFFIIISILLFFIIVIKNGNKYFDNKFVSMILTFNLLLIGIVFITIYLKENNLLNKFQEYYLAYIIEAMVLSFFGYIAPKIPFNRYIGLRLPWTVVDESTWIYSHRVCRKITIPLLSVSTIMFLIAHLVFKNLHYMYNIGVGLILLYVFIPGISSLLYYKKLYKC